MKNETIEDTRKRLDGINALQEKIYNRPWEMYHEPFKIAEGIYYLGNTFVSSFLVDTEEGLILIDCGYKETLYQVFEAIRQVGFDPRDIKYLFLTHAHGDHAAAARFVYEYSGCKIYMGKDDMFFFQDRRDLLPDESHMPEFPIDCFFDYEHPFELGNKKIHIKHTPGHTPGCTSFLIETKNLEGKQVVCGLHGGLGINGLTDEELKENGFPMDTRKVFRRTLEEALEWKVDIVLASHNLFYDMLGKYKLDDGSGRAFYDPDGWRMMLQKRLEALDKID